ncbi:hypothetical protein [Nonomuraea sp. SBT364]|uniref:hypothetical protein n=1 Tax=Nonomuraea sp. SBT364 TaxID=1580530 RepID=UPI00066CB0E8|nr:hypothetical protein [Nonomuraea sp. SBT364]
MRTEDELVTALREGVKGAPESDLLAGVTRLRKRRARRRAQFLAAAAVVAVAGTGTAVIRGAAVDGPPQPQGSVTASAEVSATVTATVTASATTSPESVRRQDAVAGELWPDAVFTMPAENSDGWRYRPITAISPTEVLLSAESSFEKAGKFEVYDSATGTARVVAEVPEDDRLKRYITQSVTVDGENLAWYAYGEQADGTQIRDIWTVPLAGGDPRLVTSRVGEDADLDAIALDGDHVVWSEVDGGVWRHPLGGSTPEKIPGSDGLHLIKWPWASDVADLPGDMERSQTRLVNLEDGSNVSVQAPPGVERLRCGPVWCFGRGSDGTVVTRVDGSQPPRRIQVSSGGPARYPILDRFLPASMAVYDLATGKLAAFGGTGTWYGMGVSSEPSAIYYWGATKGDKPDKFRVLNLAAVPPAQ